MGVQQVVVKSAGPARPTRSCPSAWALPRTFVGMDGVYKGDKLAGTTRHDPLFQVEAYLKTLKQVENLYQEPCSRRASLAINRGDPRVGGKPFFVFSILLKVSFESSPGRIAFACEIRGKDCQLSKT